MIKNNKLASLIGLVLLLAVLIVTYIQIDKTNFRYWYQDFTRENQPYTLLLGSSSILRIPSDLLVDCANPVVYGFNNGTTESIEAYFAHANFENASKIVIYIGENDIARGEAPETTFNQLEKIVDDIGAMSKGEIDLAIVKLKYSPARAKAHLHVLSFNRMLEMHFANTQGVQLIPFDKISHAQWFIADGIHLNQAGTSKFAAWINDFCRV